jgi:ketosteroid isomerase-like protein
MNVAAASGMALVLAGAATSRSQGDTEAVRAALEELDQAGLHRDVARLESLYPEGYFHTNADGSSMDRAAVLASYRAPAPGHRPETKVRDEEIVRFFGQDTAVVSSRVVLKGQDEGRLWERRFRVTWTFVRRQGRWRVVNSHASLLPGGNDPTSARDLSAREFAALLERLAEAWSRQDTEAGVACFTADAVYMQPPDQQLVSGESELRAYFSALPPGTFMTFHNVAFDETAQVGLGEFSFGRDGSAEADHGVAVIRLRDGRIASWREYFYEGPAQFAAFVAREGKSWKWTVGAR